MKAGIFQVNSTQYSGPFDLLLDLVAKRKLDITAFALAEVTEDFLAYLKQVPDLAQASQFLVVGATLLDIKASLLLPGTEAELEEDLQFLEARDLLISRLLQYRAYKAVSELLGRQLEANAHYWPRSGGNDPLLHKLWPRFEGSIDPEALARWAAEIIFSSPPQVLLEHLHDPEVPVETQREVILEKLRGTRGGRLNFSALIAGEAKTSVIVARFLAILDLHRMGLVGLEQSQALGEIEISLETEASLVEQGRGESEDE